jgi:methionine synthase II (cobalamin-independent)
VALGLDFDAGISIPTYPQLRDMNETFLDQMSGIRKEKQGWVMTGPLHVASDRLKIPEVQVIRALETQKLEFLIVNRL